MAQIDEAADRLDALLLSPPQPPATIPTSAVGAQDPSPSSPSPVDTIFREIENRSRGHYELDEDPEHDEQWWPVALQPDELQELMRRIYLDEGVRGFFVDKIRYGIARQIASLDLVLTFSNAFSSYDNSFYAWPSISRRIFFDRSLTSSATN